MQAVNSGIRDIDNSADRLQNVRSEVGEVLNRIDTVTGRLDTLKLTAKTDESNAEDLDMTAAISNFQNQQAGYQAALQSYAIVQRLSLFQYIN
jgi:flagellar hook-associated protein 3 FlgL